MDPVLNAPEKDIIIKKADKGSTVIIQDKQEYIKQVYNVFQIKTCIMNFRKTKLNR